MPEPLPRATRVCSGRTRCAVRRMEAFCVGAEHNNRIFDGYLYKVSPVTWTPRRVRAERPASTEGKRPHFFESNEPVGMSRGRLRGIAT